MGAKKGSKRTVESRIKQGIAVTATLKKKHQEKLGQLKQKLERLLTKRGPMPYREVTKELDFSQDKRRRWMRELLSEYRETFAMARIRMNAGTGGRRNFRSPELFNGLSVQSMGSIIYLKGDERIVPFVGSRLPKVKSRGQLHSVYYRLSRVFNKNLARKMIEYTGYRYCHP